MENTVEKLSGNKVKISFKVPAEDFEQAVNKAYLKSRGQIAVPGFRKGKAPRKLMERMYGAGIFYEDALDILFPEVYLTAVKENDLKPVSRPELNSIDTMESGKDLEFSCEVYVMPEVTLGEYKGVEVTRTLHKVTDEEIDHQIEHERTHVARSVEVTDRPLEEGDTAELDYSGSVDGEKFDGGTAEHQTLVIGSHSFIPGFEEQMVGMSIGEERDLQVKFPEEYHAENLKGKDAVFHVKLHAITHEELPDVDDDFAAEVSDFDTLAEYRADLEKKLQEEADKRGENAARESLIDTVVNNAEVDIPNPMVEDKLDEMMEQMAWRMQQQGFEMKRYLELLGQTEAQMREMYRGEAKKDVKSELVIDKIIEAEGIEADEAEVDKLLESYGKAMNQTLEQVKESLNEDQLDYFKHRAAVTKTFDLLWDSAKVTDAEEKAEEEAPAAEDAPEA